jgi:hypothetical protein
MERLRGRVMGEGVQLRSSKLTIGEAVFTERSKPGSLSVALEDGTEVVVRFHAPTLGPVEELRDRWEALMDHPLAEPFEDDAPGPHVKVTLEGVVVRGGDALVLEGEVERQTKTDGYRGSEESAITAIHPVLIGVGEDADAWLDDQDERAELQEALEGQGEVKAIEEPEPPDSSTLPTTWPAVGLALGTIAAGVGLGAWLLGLGYHVSRYLLFGLGLQLVISTSFVLARRRPLPWVKAVGHRNQGRGLPWAAQGAGPALFLGWVVVLLGWLGVGIEAASYAVGATMLVGLSGLVLAFVLWWLRRADARALRLLLGAKAAAGEGWGRREGTLASGRIRWDRTHDRRSSTTTQTYTDSEGRSQTRQVTSVWYEFHETVDADPLEVEMAGERISVDADGAVWGTTEVEVDDELKLSGRAREGDSLAVVGRLKEGAVRKAGPESLFLFSTRGGSAVGAARRGLWMHRLAIGTLALLGTLGMVVGWINPVQDHLRLPARVVHSDDPAIEAGDECTVRLGYLTGRGYASEPHRCQGNVSCGGKAIYGGWSFLGMGYFDCDADDLTGSDGGPDDEDGSLELRGFTGRANHGDGEVTFRFVQ